MYTFDLLFRRSQGLLQSVWRGDGMYGDAGSSDETSSVSVFACSLLFVLGFNARVIRVVTFVISKTKTAAH